jgi:hypothetical protein
MFSKCPGFLFVGSHAVVEDPDLEVDYAEVQFSLSYIAFRYHLVLAAFFHLA